MGKKAGSDLKPDRGPRGLTIRAERDEDHLAVAELITAAFARSAESRVVEAIRDSSNFVPELSRVATLGGSVVGHVMISFATLHRDEHEHRVALLAPLAVLPEFQRRGIGTVLVKDVTGLADRRREPFVLLEGSPQFYGRLGFEPAASFGIDMPIPSWAPREAAQILRLENYDTSLVGKVEYPPAFDEVIEE